MAKCLNTFGTLFIFCFYLVTTLVYFRDQIRRSSYFTMLQEQHPHTAAPTLVSAAVASVAGAVATAAASHVQPSAPVVQVVDGWGAARVLAQQPILLVAAGLPNGGDQWQFNVLRIIMEEAMRTYAVNQQVHTAVLSGDGASPVQQQTACRQAKYCVLLARQFEPVVVKDAHAVFTTHRDVRDVLLTIAQHGGCTEQLLKAFTNYAAYVPHACHDMRYEDMVHQGAAKEAQRLIGVLGMHVDLMAVVRKIGAWSKAQLAPKHKDALSFVTDDPGAHRLFRNELGKFASGSCRNLTAQLEQLRSGFGEWLVKERYEAAADESFASNVFVDELASRGALMGMRTAATDTTRCPLRSAVPDEALAPMSRAVAQALTAAKKVITSRRPSGGPGDTAEQARRQSTLSRLGLHAHSAFFEAEEAALDQASAQRGAGIRFSAGGYANFGEAAGSVTWVVQVSRDAVYRLVFLYAATRQSTPLSLLVDGAPRELPFAGTGDAMAVRPSEAAVRLSHGLHVVKLQAPRRDAQGLRVDALVVASDDAAATASLGLPDVNAIAVPGAPVVRPTPGGGKLPSLLLAGMPRAGTGLLLQQLVQGLNVLPHLDTSKPLQPVHEANHFHMLHERETLAQYRDRFVRQNGRKEDADVAVEATSSYSLCAQVPPRVHAALPAAKVVLMLRNEVDRAASHYQQCRYKGHTELGTFADTVARESARAAKCDVDRPNDRQKAWAECYLPAAVCGLNPWGSACATVVTASMYDLALEMWLQKLDPSRLMVVWSEALVHTRGLGHSATPIATPRYPASMQAVGRFAGVDRVTKNWKFVPASPQTAEASTASDKFTVKALQGDMATLETLRRLYTPHRERLVQMVTDRRVTAVWPTDAGANDPEIRTVSIKRWMVG